MISDQYKCIFIHPPKCAGESIETVFLGRPFNLSKYEGHPEKHLSVNAISRLYPVEFSSYFKFATIRNPWERVVSWVKYRDRRYGRTTGSVQERLWNDLNAEVFVDFMLAHSFVNMLFIGDKLAVDLVIPMEQLQNGFDKVCDAINMNRTQLPHCNKSDYEHYSSYYTSESRDKVSALFAGDIHAFGYKFSTG